MRGDLPAGTVTFMFTDVQGSTRLLAELGPTGYAAELAEHRRIVRDSIAAQGGTEVDTQGDAFFVAFPTAAGALAASVAITERLEAGRIQVRIGLHTGSPLLTDEGYVGADVHHAARIGAAGHGGQVLLSGTTAALVGTDGLIHLGEHQLKDFGVPTSIYQVGDRRFPPLKTLSNTNLPRPASSFVGRGAEVAAVAALVQGTSRLVTLTGPGGTGKTRLALEAAGTLVSRFKAGVFWVGLADLRDPGLVPEAIAQTIGAKDGLAAHIGGREMLLVLDNLEQVVAAAPGLASLVESCPNLRLLVTSRERLRVRGEAEYTVLPMAEAEAIALFCARADLQPDETIRDLCRALDNLPLAIELAAARASVLSPSQIRSRLSGRLDLLKGGRDADPRQQTLRATIEWSHDLLTAEEQRLFAGLAVFAGGCTIEAAEEIVAADLDTVQSLVDKSLLRHAGQRFWMLETLREFASERLSASAAAPELQRRHAGFFLALAEAAEPGLRASEPEELMDRLAEDHENLRSALDWFQESAETQPMLRLAGALDGYWADRGHVPEGLRYLESALRSDDRPTAPRAKALVAASHLARDGGDEVIGKRWAEEGLALHRALGDRWGTAYAQLILGLVVADEGDFTRARQLFTESADLFGNLGDELYALYSTRMLAWMHDATGDRKRAQAVHEDNLRRARELHARDLESSVLGALASYAAEEGRAQDAASMAAASIRIARDLGIRALSANELCRGAAALALAGEPEIAARLIASSVAFHEEAALKVLPYLTNENDQTLAWIHAKLDDRAFAAAWTEGRVLSIEAAADLALAKLAEVTANPSR